ncbi:hypothetical protein V2W45_1399399 [Cenococcum geophilum]
MTTDEWPHPGSVYKIMISGTTKVITRDGTEIRLRDWNNDSGTQYWHCKGRGDYIGFMNQLTKKYLGFNVYEVLVCSAGGHDKWEDFQVEHIGAGKFKLNMRKDDYLRPVSKITDDELKMMPLSETRFAFEKI